MKEASDLLIEAATRLKRQSPGMSVRGVAGRLEITPSYWSKILRGKKPLPPTLLPKIVKVLGLDTQQVAQLQRSILDRIERDQLMPVTGIRTSRKVKKAPTEDYRNLNREEIWLVEEWFYIPILNFCTLSNVKPTIKTIAQRLGLKVEQTRDAVHRLKHYGYLKENRDGILLRTEQKVRLPTSKSLAQVRQYHSALLQRAREELKHVSDEDFAKRLIAAVNFAGSSQKLKEARLILEEAMYRVANLMADEEKTDEVYQLSLQIFPMTKVCPE